MSLDELMEDPSKKWEQKPVKNIKAIKSLGLQEDDWSKNIVVAHKRLIVLHQFDVNLQINLNSMELMQLKQSGIKRKLFTAHYNMGDEYIFILGGQNSCNLKIENKCQKFNVNSLKWEQLPPMNQARAAAGSFMSKDKSSLFAFGGSHDSVERLPLTSNGTWQMLKVEFPRGIAFKGGLTMLPMWHYCKQLENITEDKVLIFGGGLKEVYSYDFHSNVVSEVHEAEEDSSRPKSPDSPSGGESSR